MSLNPAIMKECKLILVKHVLHNAISLRQLAYWDKILLFVLLDVLDVLNAPVFLAPLCKNKARQNLRPLLH